MQFLLRSPLVACVFLSFVFGMSYAQNEQSVSHSIDSIKAIKNDSLRDAMLVDFCSKPDIITTYSEQCISLGNEIVSSAKKRNSYKTEIDANIIIAFGYRAMNDLPRSLNYLFTAMNIATKYNDYVAQIGLNINIAQVYAFSKNLELEQKYTEDALKISEGHKLDDRDMPMLYTRMGLLSYRKKQYKEAMKYYNKGIVIAKKNNNYQIVNSLLNDLALAMQDNGDRVGALRVYEQAEALADSTHNEHSKIYAVDNIAFDYLYMNDYKNAEKYALITLPMAQKEHAVDCELDVYEVMQQVCEKEKRYPESIQYYKKWTALKDSVFNSEKEHQIAELQTKYDTKNKDNRIASQNTELAFDRKINYSLLISSVLLLAVGILIYVNLRTTVKYRRQLEALNGVKDRIFSVISHDMRTPVASMLSFMQLLEGGVISPEDMKEYSEELKDNLGYTADLMENLLSWAKTQMQGYRPVMENFDVVDTVRKVVDLLAPVARAKGITIENIITKGTIINADINMTALVIRNLLSNAIKYTRPDGIINLSSSKKSSGTQITVQDSGVGISDALVKEFNRNNTNQPIDSTQGTANEKGTGMGLMLCKSFLKLMNGAISLKSEPGKGSTFTILFIS